MSALNSTLNPLAPEFFPVSTPPIWPEQMLFLSRGYRHIYHQPGREVRKSCWNDFSEGHETVKSMSQSPTSLLMRCPGRIANQGEPARRQDKVETDQTETPTYFDLEDTPLSTLPIPPNMLWEALVNGYCYVYRVPGSENPEYIRHDGDLLTRHIHVSQLECTEVRVTDIRVPDGLLMTDELVCVRVTEEVRPCCTENTVTLV